MEATEKKIIERPLEKVSYMATPRKFHRTIVKDNSHLPQTMYYNQYTIHTILLYRQYRAVKKGDIKKFTLILSHTVVEITQIIYLHKKSL